MQIAEILREKNAFLFGIYDRKHLCVCLTRTALWQQTCAYHEKIAGIPRICNKYPHLNINQLGNDLISQNSSCDWGKS